MEEEASRKNGMEVVEDGVEFVNTVESYRDT